MTRPPSARMERALSRWAELVIRRSSGILAVTAALTLGLGVYTARNLGVDTSTEGMVSDDLGFRRTYLALQEAFPRERDQLLILVEGETPELAEDGARALVGALAADTVRFESVYQPGGGEFFERNALLFMETDSLATLVDRAEAVAPWLLELERDPTLTGLAATLASVLEERSERRGAGGVSRVDEAEDLSPLLGLLAASAFAASESRFEPVSWQTLFQGRLPTAFERRRTILVVPRLDDDDGLRARRALERVRELARELGLVERAGVRVSLTGRVAIEHEELVSALGGARQAAGLALLVVTAILYMGLRSTRLILSALSTLLVGLIGTGAFAAAAIGELNLISVAFAVLYIGLGIDYAIHLSLRYRKLRRTGEPNDVAITGAVHEVGSSLVVSAVTTAACFYAFVPTDFAGVSELGVIGGTGMFISLLVTLTVLPAALARFPLSPAEKGEQAPGPTGEAVDSGLPGLGRSVRRWRRAIIGVAGVLTIVAIVLLPRARFDSNPLNLRDPDAESVRAYRTLLGDTLAQPMTISVLRETPEAARATAARLEELELVRATRVLESFIPGERTPKTALLERLRSALGERPEPEAPSPRAIPPAVTPAALGEEPTGMTGPAAAIRDLEALLIELRWTATGQEADLARALYHLLRRWERVIEDWPEAARPAMHAWFERALVGSLSGRVQALRVATTPTPGGVEGLPTDLRDRWVGAGGQHRVEVIPREPLATSDQIARFVEAVRGVAPDATGAVVSEFETGRVAVGAFRGALLWAVAATSVILVVLLRSALGAALVVIPLLAAGVWTGGVTGLIGLPFNFANVIALPLLLGVGVDNGIHMVHRSRRVLGIGGDPLATSTARAVFYSTLTTMAGFGNLAFATHVGLASMGRLLTLGMLCVLGATLLVLPALLEMLPDRVLRAFVYSDAGAEPASVRLRSGGSEPR